MITRKRTLLLMLAQRQDSRIDGNKRASARRETLSEQKLGVFASM